ncbi:MAG: histidine kinase [Clostridia bacterium]|nr:histidine kinase [Clostridia bacterium]
MGIAEVFQNHSNALLIVFMVFALTALFYLSIDGTLRGSLCLPLQFLIITGLAVYDKSECYILYLMLIVIQQVVHEHTDMRMCIVLALVSCLTNGGLLVFRFVRYNQMNVALLLRLKLDTFFYFVLVSLLLLIIKRQMLISRQLKDAIEKIRQQSAQLQMNAAAAERNKIAREIHDTVGHTLTTASLSIEAGIIMHKEQNAKAVNQLITAREQVKKSLDQIRQSVRLLSADNEAFRYEEAILVLFTEVQKNTGIVIEKTFSPVRLKLTEQALKIIFSSIREGITNAIRHGKCTRITYEEAIDRKSGSLSFSLSDNGVGCGFVNLGMGLGAIKKDVEGLGGYFSFHSKENEGFSLTISIPCKEVSENGAY